MPESEAKKRWMRENTVQISLKFTKATDQDIISYLEGKQKQTEIKRILREYIRNANENANS